MPADEPGVYCESCLGDALIVLDLTREELATMRAAVGRCAELETALDKVTAERDEARRELDRALMDMAAGFAGIVPGAE